MNFGNIEKCSFDSSHVYIWTKKRKAGKATELFHDQMFLLSVVPLNLDRKLAHMLKWLKLDFMQALVLVMNINVHFAAVKGRRDRLDSAAAYTYIPMLSLFKLWCCDEVTLYTYKYDINPETHSGSVSNQHMETVKQMYFGQLCTRGAVVELFTLITFPLMPAACPNHCGSLPNPSRLWCGSHLSCVGAVVVARAENERRRCKENQTNTTRE